MAQAACGILLRFQGTHVEFDPHPDAGAAQPGVLDEQDPSSDFKLSPEAQANFAWWQALPEEEQRAELLSTMGQSFVDIL